MPLALLLVIHLFSRIWLCQGRLHSQTVHPGAQGGRGGGEQRGGLSLAVLKCPSVQRRMSQAKGRYRVRVCIFDLSRAVPSGGAPLIVFCILLGAVPVCLVVPVLMRERREPVKGLGFDSIMLRLTAVLLPPATTRKEANKGNCRRRSAPRSSFSSIDRQKYRSNKRQPKA